MTNLEHYGDDGITAASIRECNLCSVVYDDCIRCKWHKRGLRGGVGCLKAFMDAEYKPPKPRKNRS